MYEKKGSRFGKPMAMAMVALIAATPIVSTIAPMQVDARPSLDRLDLERFRDLHIYGRPVLVPHMNFIVNGQNVDMDRWRDVNGNIPEIHVYPNEGVTFMPLQAVVELANGTITAPVFEGADSIRTDIRRYALNISIDGRNMRLTYSQQGQTILGA